MSNLDFQTKAVAIAKKLKPDVHSKEESVTVISGEKKSTIKNWLYSNKMPPKGKRLSIADKFGVDVDYLFEDAPYNLPVTQFDSSLRCYLVPVLTLSQLPYLTCSEPLPISGRTIISLSDELQKRLNDVEKTYCLVGSGIDYEPIISGGDTIFINVSANVVKGHFCVLVGDDTRIVRVQKDGFLVTNNGETVKLTDNEKLLPIIVTMSSSYVKHAQ